MNLSVIIVSFNVKSYLRQCLNSVLASTQIDDFEVIVVDNHSTDNSIDDIRQKYNNLIVQKSDINLGYAGGCNLGSEIASGDYLLFLNNDTTAWRVAVRRFVN